MLASVSFGLYLAIGFLAAWIAWPRLSLVPQSIALLSFPLATASVYFSYTSSVWLGATLGLVIALATTLRGQIRVVVLGAISSTVFLLAVSYSEGLLLFEGASIAGEINRLIDRGLVGLILFLATCFAWWRNAWTLRNDPRAPAWARQQAVLYLAAFGVYFCQLLFHELSYSTLDNSLLFFLAGITVSLRQMSQGAIETSPELARSLAADSADRMRSRSFVPIGA